MSLELYINGTQQYVYFHIWLVWFLILCILDLSASLYIEWSFSLLILWLIDDLSSHSTANVELGSFLGLLKLSNTYFFSEHVYVFFLGIYLEA